MWLVLWASLYVLLAPAGCASKGYQIPTDISSRPIFQVDEYYLFDWGLRIELLKVVALRSDGWLLVEAQSHGKGLWMVNPAQAIGVQLVQLVPSGAPQNSLQAHQ